MEYIEEIWPHKPLLPADPHMRAMARFLTKFADDKKPDFFGFLNTTRVEQIEAVKEAQEYLKILEEHSPEKNKFFNGEEIGMTDLSMGWLAFWLEGMEEASGAQVLEINSFPRWHAWIRNFKEVPVIQQIHPDQARLLAYFKWLREMFTKPATI